MADDLTTSVSAAQAGWNGDALDALVGWLGEVNTQQFLVIDHGQVVCDQAWGEATTSTPLDIASAQKSVISVVVGILVAQGVLDLDAPMSTWLGQGWSKATAGQERGIRLRHALTMTTGLFEDFGYEADAGTTWYYNNNCYHQIRKVIEMATDQTTQQVCAEVLFGPLGMSDSTWVRRPAMKDPNGWVIEGLQTSAQDLARFGLAVMAGGADLGIDAAYLSASMRPSQDLNPSYGMLWWLLRQPRAIVPGRRPGEEVDVRKAFGGMDIDGPIAPDAPVDAVAAMGAGDQRLILLPAHDVVVIRLGGPAGSMDAAAGRFDSHLWPRLSAALPARGDDSSS